MGGGCGRLARGQSRAAVLVVIVLQASQRSVLCRCCCCVWRSMGLARRVAVPAFTLNQVFVGGSWVWSEWRG